VTNALPACVVVAATLALGAPVRADDSGQALAQRAGKNLIGMPAPPLVLKTLDGRTIDLGQLYGRQAIYLKFWATWCVPCREQMPHFERTFETAGPDLAVIAINAGFNDSIADVRDYRSRMGITMPIVIDDGRLAEAFNLRVTPQHVIIGRDGRIQYVGHLANDRLDAALVAARTTGAVTGAPVGGGAGTAVSATGHVGGSVASDTVVYGAGDLLPDLNVATLDGRQFSLRPPGGKQRTALVFLSPWCESYLAASRPGLAADCRDVRARVDALAGRSNVRWLGIASGLWATRGELAAYRDEHHVSIALTLDDSGDLFRKFHVMSVPTVLLADEHGKIVRRLEGHAALELGDQI
jgi:peroxiredoxin